MGGVVTSLLRKADTRVPALRSHLDVRTRRRRREVLQHAVGLRRPDVTAVIVADKAPEHGDVEIAERLLAAFRAASGAEAAERVDVWSEISGRQQRFSSVLARGDAEELAGYLCNVSRHDASDGIIQGAIEHDRIMRDRPYREFLALMAKDKLVSLAEAVGALAIENPEQGRYGSNLYRDAGELVERISERIGFSVTPPDVDGGLLKIDTGRGLFGERDSNAIYTAWLLSTLVAGQDGARVCEIGGGSGRVAYWARRMGLQSYTIVDLPQVNVVQGYYALKSLPPDQVTLYGERTPGTAGARLEILPAHAISELREPDYDLVLNQDSFPEINRDTVVEYLRWIRTSPAPRLVSINHESKPFAHGVQLLSVPETVRELGGFSLEHRWPYWLRRGYAVEIYRPSSLG